MQIKGGCKSVTFYPSYQLCRYTWILVQDIKETLKYITIQCNWDQRVSSAKDVGFDNVGKLNPSPSGHSSPPTSPPFPGWWIEGTYPHPPSIMKLKPGHITGGRGYASYHPLLPNLWLLHVYIMIVTFDEWQMSSNVPTCVLAGVTFWILRSPSTFSKMQRLHHSQNKCTCQH